MKNIKLTTLLTSILLFGCNQVENKKTLTTEKSNIKTIKQSPFKEDQIENEKLDEEVITNIRNVIELFKQKNIDKISNIIGFPLHRKYPIPKVNDKNELIQRFDDIFDKTLIEKIANSKIEQWNKVGWKGIMLDNGIVWMDDNGEKIESINYQSEAEKKIRENIIAKEKEDVHSSLKTFLNPIFKIKTKTSIIRIDETSEGQYRFASWKIGEIESSKPDLIIEKGLLEFLGSGGNHVIIFAYNDKYYKIYRNLMGEEGAPDITYDIEKDEKIIFTEDGTLYE